jgi:hypothetical protein
MPSNPGHGFDSHAKVKGEILAVLSQGPKRSQVLFRQEDGEMFTFFTDNGRVPAAPTKARVRKGLLKELKERQKLKAAGWLCGALGLKRGCEINRWWTTPHGPNEKGRDTPV